MTAYEIRKPPAIGNFKTPRERKSPGQKRPGQDPAYLEKLRRLRCCVCGEKPKNTVHHLKQTGQRGAGMRSPDRFGLPMCMFPYGENCHGQVEAAGSKNEIAWFMNRGVDPLALAQVLWGNRHSFSSMKKIMESQL